MKTNDIADFIKYQRERLGFTQQQLAENAGVGLRFLRELEQGKDSLRMDKVNQVLAFFGHRLLPFTEKQLDPYQVLRHYVNKAVTIHFKNRTVQPGILLRPVMKDQVISGWEFLPNLQAITYQQTQDPGLIETIPHASIESITV